LAIVENNAQTLSPLVSFPVNRYFNNNLIHHRSFSLSKTILFKNSGQGRASKTEPTKQSRKNKEGKAERAKQSKTERAKESGKAERERVQEN